MNPATISKIARDAAPRMQFRSFGQLTINIGPTLSRLQAETAGMGLAIEPFNARIRYNNMRHRDLEGRLACALTPESFTHTQSQLAKREALAHGADQGTAPMHLQLIKLKKYFEDYGASDAVKDLHIPRVEPVGFLPLHMISPSTQSMQNATVFIFSNAMPQKNSRF